MGEIAAERNAQWARVRGRLRAEFGDGVFRSWLKPMELAAEADGTIRIGVPTRFMRDRVSQFYGDRLRALWADEDELITEVELIVTPVSMPRRPSGPVETKAPPVS